MVLLEHNSDNLYYGTHDKKSQVSESKESKCSKQLDMQSEFLSQPKRLDAGWAIGWSEFESQQGQEFSLLHNIQTDSGAHLASYLMGTKGSFPSGKAARAGSWPLTSN
jgi:hypothetical protein